MRCRAPRAPTGPVSGLDEVMSRFDGDAEFRDSLVHRPRDALEGYRLTRAELDELSARLAEACGGTSVAERRHALAGLLRLLAVTAEAPEIAEP
jgi:hypothetical protein